MKRSYCAIVLLILFSACKTTKTTVIPPVTPGEKQVVHPSLYRNVLDSLLQTNADKFSNIISRKDSLRIQIIYTQIDRDAGNKASFTDYTFNLNNDLYFYPASTVKMPVAFLALEKLNNLKIPGVNKYTPMITNSSSKGQTYVFTEPLSRNSVPSVANYAKQIFLVSDNDAFNRLYELLGQQYIKEQLAAKGYKDAEIRHRLQVSLTDEQNRQTNAISFFDTSDDLLLHQPAQYSKATFAKRNTELGIGYLRNDVLINEPFTFSNKNRIYLQDLHNMLRSVLFPEAVPEKQRFNLTADDYKFLYRYMSAYPYESSYPNYDTTEYYDTYVKFLYYGSEKTKPDPNIRIFNKVGDAYGFLTDVAYIVDFANKIEFMLSATIYCNSDGIFNDDKYDYDNTGYPFMKQLGQVIYQYERRRKKAFLPDLTKFRMDYSAE